MPLTAQEKKLPKPMRKYRFEALKKRLRAGSGAGPKELRSIGQELLGEAERLHDTGALTVLILELLAERVGLADAPKVQAAALFLFRRAGLHPNNRRSQEWREMREKARESLDLILPAQQSWLDLLREVEEEVDAEMASTQRGTTKKKEAG